MSFDAAPRHAGDVARLQRFMPCETEEVDVERGAVESFAHHGRALARRLDGHSDIEGAVNLVGRAEGAARASTARLRKWRERPPR